MSLVQVERTLYFLPFYSIFKSFSYEFESPVTFLKEVCREAWDYLSMFLLFHFFFLLYLSFSSNGVQSPAKFENESVKKGREKEGKKGKCKKHKVYAFSGVNLNWTSWFRFATQKKNSGLRA